MKTFLKLGAATAALGSAAVALRGNTALTVTPYILSLSGLPAAFDGLRIVQLSDLHAASFGNDQAALLAIIESLEPDLVLITGDLIDRRRTMSEEGMRPALVLLRELAKRFPTVRVDGNHEAMSPVGNRFRALAEHTGVPNITGRGLPVRKGDDRLVLLGIPDIAAVHYDDDAWRRNLQTIYAPYVHDFCIALSHRPQYFDDYETAGLPLVLCGHAHGGQVRLPYIGGLYAPEQGIFPKYTAGVHGEKGTRMVVSRGLGNSGFPVRFGNRPEVVAITLKRR